MRFLFGFLLVSSCALQACDNGGKTASGPMVCCSSTDNTGVSSCGCQATGTVSQGGLTSTLTVNGSSCTMTSTFQGNTATSVGTVVSSCDNTAPTAPAITADAASRVSPDAAPVDATSSLPPDAASVDAASSVPPDAASVETASSGSPDAASLEAASTSDASTSDASAEDAATFTPTSIGSKLTFWLDPTSLVQGDAGKVAMWTDLSGNGNDAKQSDPTYQPDYSAAAFHGLPSATFTGPITFLDIADTPSMRWGKNDLLVLVVFRATPQSTTDCMLYQKTGALPYDGASLYLQSDKPSPSTLAGAQVSGQVYVPSSPPPTTFVDGNIHLLGIRRAGTTLEIRVDGALSNSIANASVAGVDVSAIGYDATIGQNGYGMPPQTEFQQCHGDIAEEIGVNGSVSPTELANLEQYLKARYAIP